MVSDVNLHPYAVGVAAAAAHHAPTAAAAAATRREVWRRKL